ncbi:hypothetical protein INT43_004078 [Umbelopsis isabellina]|uniref:Uncharacterized protein n=1 Tax=Mortierella isabellina TaxID=91625 RepID=A0A8H7PVJ6_MORIS|nr:hypothetical protein INT43_004078 [Umbelopsis isabellina]
MDVRNTSKPLLSSHDSSDNIKSYHSMLFHKAYDDKKAPETQESGFSSRPDTPRPKTKRTTSTGAFIIEDNDNLSRSAFERSNNQYSSSPR